jgi:Na+-transporting methylmalonyl-CoA/oxaloacetate decarboxylase gamma subunit
MPYYFSLEKPRYSSPKLKFFQRVTRTIKGGHFLQIPILSTIVSGLGTFFRTRRYLAYTTIFVFTTFLALFMSWLMTLTVGTSTEQTLFYFFAYLGSTGTIYFALGTLFTGIGADRLWITRRGRGRVTEMKGISWMAVSFAASVFLSILAGPSALLFFAMFCWIGWIAFQAFLSTRTSLRVATLAEPKKGGIALGIGSFILLIIGLGLIAVEALAALWLIPSDAFGIGTMVQGLPLLGQAISNLQLESTYLIIAYGSMGLFAVVMLVAFLRYAGRGAALNIAFLTFFISIYAGYFLFNVMRRSGVSGMGPVDIFMSLFFLAYAMSGIGRTVTDSIEESRVRTGDLGPLLTFFLASGFFYVDSIISVAGTTTSQVAVTWFQTVILNDPFFLFLFRDVAKLIAFPLTAIFTAVYYLRVQRTERMIEHAKEHGETFEPGKADEDLVKRAPEPGKPWPSEKAEGIKKGKPGYDLSAPDSERLTVDKSRRLGQVKRLGEEEDEEEDD